MTGAADRSARSQAGLGAAMGGTLARIGPVGTAAAATGAAIFGTVNQAVNFGTAMADVPKVLDMSDEGIEALGDDILGLSLKIPLARPP